jgi:hypothetical protein
VKERLATFGGALSYTSCYIASDSTASDSINDVYCTYCTVPRRMLSLPEEKLRGGGSDFYLQDWPGLYRNCRTRLRRAKSA